MLSGYLSNQVLFSLENFKFVSYLKYFSSAYSPVKSQFTWVCSTFDKKFGQSFARKVQAKIQDLHYCFGAVHINTLEFPVHRLNIRTASELLAFLTGGIWKKLFEKLDFKCFTSKLNVRHLRSLNKWV